MDGRLGIAELIRQQLAEAEYERIADDFAVMHPESDPDRYAAIQKRLADREAEIAEHRKTCNCPYCGIDGF